MAVSKYISSVLRTLGIPELLNSIFSHLRRSALARLMRVSHFFFEYAAALVWKDLAGVVKLLSLIPGTVVQSGRQRGPRMSLLHLITIKLPESAAFNRFEIYSPFIKTLDIPDCYRFRGGQLLRAYCDTHPNGLLPNLASLTCHYGETQRSRAIFEWIGFFLCPSLLQLLAVPLTGDNGFGFGPRKELKASHITELLRHLPQKCPSIREIQMIATDETSLSDAVDKPSMYDALVVLPRLQQINGSEILLEPRNLDLLGMLPHLESLVIHSNYRETSVLIRSWPSSYFPKICRLHLRDMRPETISLLCAITPLVQHLTELDVRFLEYSQRVVSQSSEWATSFIRNLPDHSAHIHTFALSFRGLALNCVKLSFSELDSLRRLALKSLYMWGVEFIGGVDHLNFVLAIPNIRVLRMISTPIELRDVLVYAANLAQLHVLSIRISFDPNFSIENINHAPFIHKVVLEDLDLYPVQSYAHLRQTARQLLWFWPGIQCTMSDERIIRGNGAMLCNRLNKMIEICRNSSFKKQG